MFFHLLIITTVIGCCFCYINLQTRNRYSNLNAYKVKVLGGEDIDDYEEIEVQGTHTILDELMAAGIKAPHSCKAGLCTECGCLVVQGMNNVELDAAITDEDAIAKGFILSCSARVKGDITIKLGVGEDMYEEQFGDFRREHESFQEGNEGKRGNMLDGILNLNTEA